MRSPYNSYSVCFQIIGYFRYGRAFFAAGYSTFSNMNRVNTQCFDPVYFFNIFPVCVDITITAVTMEECGDLGIFIRISGKRPHPLVKRGKTRGAAAYRRSFQAS
jgi:hypothetical protein